MNILDLPEDVLVLILAELEPHDFLTFCRVTKSIYTDYRQYAPYWAVETAETFRLPISLLLQADGPRWYWLYKRLKTQTRLFTWGQGIKGNLGQMRGVPRRVRGHPVPVGRLHPARRVVQVRTSSEWPTETHIPVEVGVVADLQCGGWSTSILSSEGKLFAVGSIDSTNGISRGTTVEEFERLEYLTQSTSAIRQFSSGRAHVLALTDDGEILSWDRVNAKGLKILSRHGRFQTRATRVAGGWGQSSAYIPDTGIVYWAPVRNDQNNEELDGVHVKEKVIPGTARKSEDGVTNEVVKHIVLEDFIVWITNESKLFACRLGGGTEEDTEPVQPPFQVPGYAAEGRKLKDVQGQFRTFGVFTANGEVLAGNKDYLDRVAEACTTHPELANLDLTNQDEAWSIMTDLLSHRSQDIPAMQHTGVIQLAYGDYHYHALHADGTITSYGKDPRCSGLLGLGKGNKAGIFRGLKQTPPSIDASMLRVGEIRGRQVWFEPEKKQWLDELGTKILGDQADNSWLEDVNKQAMYSEWIEQEGRRWADGPTSSTSSEQPVSFKAVAATGDYDHLGAHFAISISAAGWHSGALVIVDEIAAEKTRHLWIHEQQSDIPHIPGSFENHSDEEHYVWQIEGIPRVELMGGFITPGEGEVRPWRDGKPSPAQLGIQE